MVQFWRNGGWLVVGVVALIAGSGGASAANIEFRDFTVSVDGKGAGEYRMTITAQDNGTLVMTGKANVTVRKYFLTYTYSYSGVEVWQGKRLLRLESTANDNGKPYTLKAVAEGSALRVEANGQQRSSRPDVWTTTYWQLPEPRFRNGPVPLLDADTGRAIDGRMQNVGATQIQVAGAVQNCPHYRITGDKLQVDVWYDTQERMVRQESLEDGHLTVLELAGLRR
jgi:hypothetical protein